MFVHYRTLSLIFKKDDRGEADQVFSVFTKDFGKIEVLGRAIRKSKSKLRGGADIFYLTDMEFIQGKAYKTLTEALLVEKFPNIRKELGKLKISHKIAETLSSFLKGEEKDPKAWDLTVNTFNQLNQTSLSLKYSLLLYYYFFWNFISALGYTPQLYNCVICQKKLSFGQLYFNNQEGGTICGPCFKKIKRGQKINQDFIKILRFLLEKDWDKVKKLKINQEHLKTLSIACDDYLFSPGERVVSQF